MLLTGGQTSDYKGAAHIFEAMPPVVVFLQRVLNVLNRQGRDYPDPKVDGSAGPATATALRTLIARRGIVGRNAVLTYLAALQGAGYVELGELCPANEGFMRGWVRRVAFTFPLTIGKAA